MFYSLTVRELHFTTFLQLTFVIDAYLAALIQNYQLDYNMFGCHHYTRKEFFMLVSQLMLNIYKI